MAPITSTLRGMALEVTLNETTTPGVVLIHQMRSLDVESWDVEFIEKAPDAIIKKVTELAMTIVR